MELTFPPNQPPSPSPTALVYVANCVPQPAEAPLSSGMQRRQLSTDLSPPLIALVAVLGMALLIVLYARVLSKFLNRIRRRRRRRRFLISSSPSSFFSHDLGSPSPPDYLLSSSFAAYRGLDESVIKALPLWFYSKKQDHKPSSLFLLPSSNAIRECAVCLLEFEEHDSLRSIPSCAHAFHVDCIDAWLRCHATCPLCRAAAVSSPFIPLRAARIRPSLDEIFIEQPPPQLPPLISDESEIALAPSSPEINNSSSSNNLISGRSNNFLLKRSYSFGFERSLALEAATASPWRSYRRSFWSKRWPSPFTTHSHSYSYSSSAPRHSRVFSSFRFVKSPFVLRRRGIFFPSRSRSMVSPTTVAGYSSSRLRTGDPEALLSPERLRQR